MRLELAETQNLKLEFVVRAEGAYNVTDMRQHFLNGKQMTVNQWAELDVQGWVAVELYVAANDHKGQPCSYCSTLSIKSPTIPLSCATSSLSRTVSGGSVSGAALACGG